MPIALRPHPPVALSTRENCPLCDEMKAQVDLAGLGGRFGWRVESEAD